MPYEYFPSGNSSDTYYDFSSPSIGTTMAYTGSDHSGSTRHSYARPRGVYVTVNDGKHTEPSSPRRHRSTSQRRRPSIVVHENNAPEFVELARHHHHHHQPPSPRHRSRHTSRSPTAPQAEPDLIYVEDGARAVVIDNSRRGRRSGRHTASDSAMNERPHRRTRSRSRSMTKVDRQYSWSDDEAVESGSSQAGTSPRSAIARPRSKSRGPRRNRRSVTFSGRNQIIEPEDPEFIRNQNTHIRERPVTPLDHNSDIRRRPVTPYIRPTVDAETLRRETDEQVAERERAQRDAQMERLKARQRPGGSDNHAPVLERPRRRRKPSIVLVAPPMYEKMFGN